MILFPAIDLKDGLAVRLEQGDMARATVFNRDPAAQAAAFAAQGFEYLHVVDLDGAFAGKPMNAGAVERILAVVNIPVQLGGGIRTYDDIVRWIDMGVSRVILGTVAVRDPALVKRAAHDFPEQIAVAIDVKDGKVAVHGWVEASDMEPIDLARQFEDSGVAALIVTDIGRDGALTGLNIDAVGQMADAVHIPVIASGGLASVRDIELLKARPGAPIAGAILGRAIYTGAITPDEAIRAARRKVPA